MGIEIPGSLRWVAETVCGTHWPDADETAMQRCADHWDTASTAIGSLNALSDDTVKQLLDSIEGDVNDAITKVWQKVGGDAGAMRELLETCDQLAEMLDGAAQDVRRAKLAIIANLVTLAASLVAAAATVWAFGAGAAAGAAATLATRASIQLIIRQLITQMLQRIIWKEAAKAIAISAALNAAKEGGIEGGLQAYETSNGLRDGYDVGDIAQAGGHGAVKGAVQSAFKIGARGGGVRSAGKFYDIQKKGADAVTKESLIGSQVGKGVADLTVGKPEEGVGSRVRDAVEESGIGLSLPPDKFPGENE